MATVVAAGTAIVLAVSGAQAAGTPGWRVAVDYGNLDNGMSSVSASGAADAWGIGQCFYSCVVTTHWNGKKWQVLPVPPTDWGPYMTGAGVAAIGQGRAWVFVNQTNEELGVSVVDAAEWTGTSWSGFHDFGSLLPSGPIASGPDDVWGFGSGATPWAVHYNGTSWSQIPVPVNVSQSSASATAGDWVLGTAAAQPARVQLLHWGKGAWRNAVLPKIAVSQGDQLFPGLLEAASTSDLWVSVFAGPVKGRGTVTNFVLHWNGKAWSRILVPKLVNQNGLAGLASDGHGGAWVATYAVNKPSVIVAGLVMYHYTGGRFTRVPVPAGVSATNLGGTMELIPGTQSVLAPASGPGGAILKYGP
jgi:hypothetical protein